MSLNRIQIIGHVGADPEVKTLNNGTKVVTIRVATTEKWTDRDGTNHEETQWHTVTLWRRLADIVGQFVRKGSALYVEGKMVYRQWTDQSGSKRISAEIEASDIQLLDKKADTGNQAAASQQAAVPAPQSGYAPLPGPDEIGSDEQ